MNSDEIQRENPYRWMMKQPLFWFEIFCMSIIPLPIGRADSFFEKVVYMDCINWMGNDGNAAATVKYDIPYTFKELFIAGMFLRFFFVFQTLVVVSPPNNKLVAKRICHEQGIDPTFGFQMKAAFKQRPLGIFLALLAFSIISFSSLIRIFERPYYINYKEDYPDITYYYFKDYQSTVWFVLITMTSVGFGNVITVTPLGRAVTLFAAFTGAIFLAMMVTLLYDWLSLDDK